MLGYFQNSRQVDKIMFQTPIKLENVINFSELYQLLFENSELTWVEEKSYDFMCQESKLHR